MNEKDVFELLAQMEKENHAKNTFNLGKFFFNEKQDTIKAYLDCEEIVHIPEGIKYLGPMAFHMINNLREIYITEGVLGIRKQCFWNCSNLHTVHLPQTLKKIGDEVFRSCYSLSELTLPKSVKEIGNDVFARCNLQKLVYEGNASDWARVKMSDETRVALAPLLVCLR